MQIKTKSTRQQISHMNHFVRKNNSGYNAYFVFLYDFWASCELQSQAELGFDDILIISTNFT